MIKYNSVSKKKTFLNSGSVLLCLHPLGVGVQEICIQPSLVFGKTVQLSKGRGSEKRNWGGWGGRYPHMVPAR